MEQKKNQTASFLMVVGIIFIVVAGTIFVSTAWKYLPTGGKQCILFLTTLGLYAGAGKLAKNGFMEKTETTLYYLATSFLGLFSLSVCGAVMGMESSEWIINSVTGWNEEAILFSGVIMLIPVVARYIRKRSAFDFTLMALLSDWVVFWFALSRDFGIFGSCVLSAVGITAYTLADCLREKWQDGNKHVEQVFLVLYVIHLITFASRNLTLLLIDDIAVLKAALFTMAIFIMGITTLQCAARNQEIFRVFNSVAVYWLVITSVIFLNEFLSGGMECPWNGEMVHFIAFTICAVCMVIFARNEMGWMTAIWGGVIPFIQITQYGDYNVLFSHVRHTPSVYLPFTGIFVAAMAGLLVRKLHDGEMDEEKAKQYGLAVGMQVFVMGILFYASGFPFFAKGMWSIWMVQCIAATFLFENETVKKLFQTFALAAGEILALLCTNDWIPDAYLVEWGCLMAAVGIYMLRWIWDKDGEDMKIFQFICTCIILSVMLCHAVTEGGVINGIILGITSAVMLVAAALKNSRRYVILASVVLILLAFYITRSFWFSIAWWVYLFVTGVIFVLIAIKKEREGK